MCEKIVGKWGQGHFTWSWTPVRTWGDTRVVECRDLFMSPLQMLPHAYTVHTHPHRANQAATGTSLANDKQDKLSPLMTHDYTCLRSCAREVFTTPDAKRWQSRGPVPCLSLSAVPAKYPNISIRFCSCIKRWVAKPLGRVNHTKARKLLLLNYYIPYKCINVIVSNFSCD